MAGFFCVFFLLLFLQAFGIVTECLVFQNKLGDLECEMVFDIPFHILL